MENQQQKDHDLLIEIKTIVSQLVSDVKDIKTDTVGRVEKLELTCATKLELEEANKKIRGLELARSNQKIQLAIYIGIGVFLSGLMIYHILGKI